MTEGRRTGIPRGGCGSALNMNQASPCATICDAASSSHSHALNDASHASMLHGWWHSRLQGQFIADTGAATQTLGAVMLCLL